MHGHCSLVPPADWRTAAAVLKISFPDDESEHEYLALRLGRCRRRYGCSAPTPPLACCSSVCTARTSPVPRRRRVPGGRRLYWRIHVPCPVAHAPPTSGAGTSTWLLPPRSISIPRRLVEQAAVSDLTRRAGHRTVGPSTATCTTPTCWPPTANLAVIDPKLVNGDPHYEIAPMLWNRRDGNGRDVREGVRRRFHTWSTPPGSMDRAGGGADGATTRWALQWDGPQAIPAGWTKVHQPSPKRCRTDAPQRVWRVFVSAADLRRQVKLLTYLPRSWATRRFAGDDGPGRSHPNWVERADRPRNQCQVVQPPRR